jgi:hypothetical protein
MPFEYKTRISNGVLKIGTPKYTSYCTKRQCCTTYQTVEEGDGQFTEDYLWDNYECTRSHRDAKDLFFELEAIWNDN